MGAFLRENARNSVQRDRIGHPRAGPEGRGQLSPTDWSPQRARSLAGSAGFTPPVSSGGAPARLRAHFANPTTITSTSPHSCASLKETRGRSCALATQRCCARRAGKGGGVDWGQGNRMGQAEVTCVPCSLEPAQLFARGIALVRWVVRSPSALRLQGDSGVPGFADVAAQSGRSTSPRSRSALSADGEDETASRRTGGRSGRAGRGWLRRLVACTRPFDLSDGPGRAPARLRAAARGPATRVGRLGDALGETRDSGRRGAHDRPEIS